MRPRPNYQDTATGAIVYLRKVADQYLDLRLATAEVDRSFGLGIWKVSLPKEQGIDYVLVTLKGYLTLTREHRERDDYEIFYHNLNEAQEG